MADAGATALDRLRGRQAERGSLASDDGDPADEEATYLGTFTKRARGAADRFSTLLTRPKRPSGGTLTAPPPLP